jgi:outer membrane protein assembly factor BamD (BamD/ComL family)
MLPALSSPVTVLLLLLSVRNAERFLAHVPPPPGASARLCFKQAAASWDKGAYDQAAGSLEEFLRAQPHSRHAAEARYKLGSAYLLLGKGAEARTAFADLARNHFQTPWAHLALAAHYDEPSLAQLAEDKLRQARASRQAEDANAAIRVFDVYARRFPQGKTSWDEVVYKMAGCYLLAGKDEAGLAGLKKVAEHDREGPWGKLAAIRLAGPTAFREHMDELMNLEGVKEEHSNLFLELAEKALPDLEGEDRVKCLYYQACCLRDDSKERRLALYESIVAEHPGSPWAAEAAFAIAEHHFAEKDFDLARAAYVDMAERYPLSPRAAVARRWARWAAHQEEARAALQEAVTQVLHQICEGAGGYAFRLELPACKDLPRPVQVRFAWQGESQDAYLGVHYGDTGIELANNQDGLWCHLLDQVASVTHVKQRLPLPPARLWAQEDPILHMTTCGLGLTTDRESTAASAAQALPVLTRGLGELVSARDHLHRAVRRDGEGQERVVIVCESAARNDPRPVRVEVELNAAGKPHEVRYYDREDGHRKMARLTDIVLGEQLPASTFEVHVPAGVEVRTLDQIDPFALFAHAFRMMSVLGNDLAHQPASH